ncbi:hypothetical protein [Candidatus Viadribacter manganicus]|uniref:Uncharacterized protein n=1 Tax=Candidatus Viadribacter manganicus TaxID=1759059 RepID=A0A1B1ALG7_9PROT|nr:hypothetical protein [Candidatus Viadribacter manganicus]ANP47412.1 hypothetical protein ATE48_16590 [Candidatus Viadribacter manganicus]
MARYVVTAPLASAPINYLYVLPEKALAKIRRLQRQAIGFEIHDANSGAPRSVEELERKVTGTS